MRCWLHRVRSEMCLGKRARTHITIVTTELPSMEMQLPLTFSYRCGLCTHMGQGKPMAVVYRRLTLDSVDAQLYSKLRMLSLATLICRSGEMPMKRETIGRSSRSVKN
jgi:hypothetical protein